MIIYRFYSSKAKECHSCSSSHSGHKERDGPANSIKQETLKRVIVECPNCASDNQSMVLGVDMAVQKFVLVHVSVYKVLPSVHDKHCNYNLQNLDD